MFLSEIQPNRNLKVSVDIKGEITSFSGFIFFVFDGKILISKLTKNDTAINFGDHKVDIHYKSPFDNEEYIFKDCDIKLVKYKGNIYHQISTNMSSTQSNRRRAYRQSVNIDGVVTIDREPTGVMIHDISKYGLAFISDKTFIMGSSCEVLFKDEGMIFQERCKIVRVQSLDGVNTLYGCELLSENPQIEKYISKKQKIEST